MINGSYLLVIDGTAESRAAAYLAWELAEKTGSRIVAQHVINVPAIRNLLSLRKPGFVGSGIYLEAAERIKESLRSVAESVTLSYEAQAEGRNIKFETCIDEGDPLAEITKRVQSHDLLIIGHDPSVPRQPDTYSLCEELAETCNCSMLIVNASCNDWSEIHIGSVSVATEPDATASGSFVEFAKALGLSSELRPLPAAMSKRGLRSYLRHFMEPALLLWRQTNAKQPVAS
jgi:nucleotide-binding universal stress UspA family protein